MSTDTVPEFAASRRWGGAAATDPSMLDARVSLPPSLRSRLRRPRPDTPATGLALAFAALLIGLGLAVSLLTWRRPAVVSLPTEFAAVASVVPALAEEHVPPPANRRTARVGRLVDDSSVEELARQFQDAPHGRWAYALRSNDRQQRRATAPAEAPPHRIISVVPESALGFAWPLTGAITSAFTETHPLGIDIAPAESPGLVLAARDGVVLLAGGDPCCNYGYVVLLDHGGGLTSLYGHLQEPPLVRAGERLERGTVLGHAGETGHAEGVHLHFEVRLHGVPVDPELVLTGGRLTPLPAGPRATAAPAPPDIPVPVTTLMPRPAPAPAAPPAPVPVERAAEAATEPLAPPSASPEPSAVQAGAPSPPPAPSPSRSSASRTTPAPSPRTTASPTPRAPQSPSAVASASPGATTATASPLPSPPAGADPTVVTPRCDTVRLQNPEERTAPTEGVPEPFITLEADPETVTSLVAERCEGGARITVVVKPTGNRQCGVLLTAREGDRRRRLAAEQTPGGEAARAGETRWLIPLADLWPESVLRVSCTPAEARIEP